MEKNSIQTVEIIEDVPDNPFSEPLIKNKKPLKKVSEEEVRKIKERNQKKLIEMTKPPEPPIATNKISKAEVEKIKSRNKRKGKIFTEIF